MTLANNVSLIRILATPIFVISILYNRKIWGCGIFLFCIILDLLDGLLARMLNEETRLGAIIDPLADKLLLGSGFILLAIAGDIPVWIAVLLIFRDMLLIFGWLILYLLSSSVAFSLRPTALGKLTYFLQAITLLLHLLPFSFPEASYSVMLGIMLTATLLSTISYIRYGMARVEGG
jgi:cardiolipin synthase